MRLVDQQCLGRDAVLLLEVITEAVGNRFKKTEGLDVCLLLTGVHATRSKRHRDIVAGVFCGLLHAHTTREHNQVGQGDFLATTVELALDAFEFCQHIRQLRRLVSLPGFLRGQAQATAVGTASFVGTTETRGRRPSGRHQLRNRQARGRNFAFERGDIAVVDQWVIDIRNRVLPQQLFCRHFRAEVARERTHVAVDELVPGAGEGIGQLVWIGQEAPRDGFVDRVEA
ncbi:hypothetical protein D3C81_1545810 [compost metagenome]